MAEVELGKRLELLEIADSPKRPPNTRGTLAPSSMRRERQARLSRQERLRIVEQALLLMEMNYVHLPMKRAIHAIDPIQQLKLLRFQLAEWNVGPRKHDRLPSPHAVDIRVDARPAHAVSAARTVPSIAPRICHFSSSSVSSGAANDSS